jgi:hypothetical protein
MDKGEVITFSSSFIIQTKEHHFFLSLFHSLVSLYLCRSFILIQNIFLISSI